MTDDDDPAATRLLAEHPTWTLQDVANYREEGSDYETVRKVAEEVKAEYVRVTDMWRLGFRETPIGELVADGCHVNFYSCCGEWEIFINLPNGDSVSMEVPFDKVACHVKKQEAQQLDWDDVYADDEDDLARQCARSSV